MQDRVEEPLEMALEGGVLSTFLALFIHGLAALVVTAASFLLTLSIFGLVATIENGDITESLGAALLVAVPVALLSGLLYAAFGRGVSSWLRQLAGLLLDFSP